MSQGFDGYSQQQQWIPPTPPRPNGWRHLPDQQKRAIIIGGSVAVVALALCLWGAIQSITGGDGPVTVGSIDCSQTVESADTDPTTGFPLTDRVANITFVNHTGAAQYFSVDLNGNLQANMAGQGTSTQEVDANQSTTLQYNVGHEDEGTCQDTSIQINIAPAGTDGN